jgi:hypothetical protein
MLDARVTGEVTPVLFTRQRLGDSGFVRYCCALVRKPGLPVANHFLAKHTERPRAPWIGHSGRTGVAMVLVGAMVLVVVVVAMTVVVVVMVAMVVMVVVVVVVAMAVVVVVVVVAVVTVVVTASARWSVKMTGTSSPMKISSRNSRTGHPWTSCLLKNTSWISWKLRPTPCLSNHQPRTSWAADHSGGGCVLVVRSATQPGNG